MGGSSLGNDDSEDEWASTSPQTALAVWANGWLLVDVGGFL